MKERRNDPRKYVGLLVRLRFADIDTFIERFATNISRNGMFIRSRDMIEAGTTIFFDMRVPDFDFVIRGEAVVKWVRELGDMQGPAGIGLEFVKLDHESRELLEQFTSDTRTPFRNKSSFHSSVETTSAVLAKRTTRLDDGVEIIEELKDEYSAFDAGADPDDKRKKGESGEHHHLPELVFLSHTEEPPATGPIIGIDLGTTNSCVAVVRNGRAEIIKTKEGNATIPSVIGITTQGKLLVGNPARSLSFTHPQRIVYGAKRLVGRRFDSPLVQEIARRSLYHICPDRTGKAAVIIEDQIISLEEVQALILSECRNMAENAIGEPVHRAVITVPAYYSDSQRQAVREAGRLAGMRVERIVNEPTAAALAYGLNKNLKKKIIVYDLGGGTFDATILDIEGNIFDVLATAGDTFLGGADFDNQIVDFLLKEYEKNSGLAFTGEAVALSRLVDASEFAKMQLSESLTYDVSIPFIMLDPDGLPRDLKSTLTRNDIEKLSACLVDRTIDVVRDVLLDARLKPGDIEDVLLAGGQSRMPLVRQKITKLFGREPHSDIHPDEAVALGAALYGDSLEQIGGVILIDVLPMTIGIGLPGGRFKRVIERNTSLPVHRSYVISTTRKDQTDIVISVFQGEDTHVSGNEYLGTLRLSGLPKGPEGASSAVVTFHLGPECILEVSAKVVATGREIRTVFSTRYTPEKLRRQLGIKASEARNAEAQSTAEIARRGGRFWRALRWKGSSKQ